MYQLFNIPQFKEFLKPYIEILSHLPEEKFNHTVKHLKRILTSDDKYMHRANFSTIKTEYEKQLIAQDTMRVFKPTPELKKVLDYVIPKIVEDYIDLSRFNNLDYLENFYKKLEVHNAKELEQIEGFYLTRFEKLFSMEKLLKQFTQEKPTENNSIILFKRDDDAILVVFDKNTKEVQNIFNYRNKSTAVELLNIIIKNKIENTENINSSVIDKVEGIYINNKIYNIESFENLSKIEINHDFIIDTTKLYKLPDVIVVKGNLIIKKCNPFLSMQERCTVVGNFVIHTKMNKLARVMTVGGIVDMRHSTIETMPQQLFIKQTCILHNSNITKLPKKLAVGGGLSLNSMIIDEMPKELYVENHLDMYKAKVNELPDVMFVGQNCDIRDTDITYVGPKTRINGTLFKNSKVTISKLAEIKQVSG